MKKYALLVAVFATLAAASAVAHVTVKPTQVSAAAFQTFTVSVPNEKDNPTVSLRLVLPEGLNYVTPNVKPGWTVTVKKSGSGDSAVATEILWSSGSLPVGFREEFVFSAQVPAKPTKLIWKAYQLYQNGQTVPWDRVGNDDHQAKDGKSHHDQGHDDAHTAQSIEEKAGPASTTSIVDETPKSVESMHSSETGIGVLELVLLLIAALSLAFSIAAFVVAKRKANP